MTAATVRLSLIIDGQTRDAEVSVKQLEDAMRRLKGQADAAGPAINSAMGQAGRGAAQATQLSTQQLANMQFQLQDMAVGLASGQSPFTVMMQQGSQLAQMFQPGTGVMAALRSAGAGVVQFLTNPLNLAVAAFGILASAGVTAFSSIVSGSGEVEDSLSRQEEMIKRIAERYTEAGQAAEQMGLSSRLADLREARDQRGEFEADARAQLEALVSGLTGDRIADPLLPEAERQRVLMQALADDYGIFSDAIARLLNDIAAGGGDIRAFHQEIEALGSGAKDDAGVQSLLRSIRALTKDAADADNNLQKADSAVRILDGTGRQLDFQLHGLSARMREATGAADGLARSIGKVPATIDGYGRASPFAGAPAPDFKSLLDLIAHHEGTDRGRGYNETLAYGKYTNGPVDLVTMTLNQVQALQKQMLAHPDNTFNSSAVGRYQITSETLRDFMPRLGLDGNTLFTPEVQDRIAMAIINMAGRDAGKLSGRWEGFKFVAPETILKAYDDSAPQRVTAAEQQAKLTLADAKVGEAFAKAMGDAARSTELLTGNLGKSAAEIARNRTEQQLWTAAERDYGDRLKTDAALQAEVARQIRARGDAAAQAANMAAHLARQEDLTRLSIQEQAEAYRDMEARRAEFFANFQGLGQGLVTSIAQAREAGDSWFDSFGAGLDHLRDKGLSMLDSLIDRMLDASLLGTDGESGFLGSLLDGLFSGLFGSTSLNPLQNAFGNAFDKGAVTAFATGGIVSSPVLFPMMNGLGLMGEAGPEAIMPLTRTASGHLGVRAETSTQTIFNIAFPAGPIPAPTTALEGRKYSPSDLRLAFADLAPVLAPSSRAAEAASQQMPPTGASLQGTHPSQLQHALTALFSIPNVGHSAPAVLRAEQRQVELRTSLLSRLRDRESANGDTPASQRPPINITVHNSGHERVETRSTDRSDGGVDIEVMVGQALNRHLATGRADDVLRQRFGVGPRTEGWG